jgi:hypothetical protein
MDVRLPNGVIVRGVPDGMSRADLAEKLRSNGMDVPDDWLAKPNDGITGAFGKGVESLISSGRTAFGALTGDAEAAAQEGLARGESIGRRYKDETGWDKVSQKYNDPNGGIMSAAGEVLRQTPLFLAEQAPNIAATLASAKAGAMTGAAVAPFLGPAAPAGPVIGGALGAFAPSFVQHLGGNIERQAAEKKPVNVGSAAGTAAIQGGLDTAATALVLGKSVIGKVLGPQVSAIMERGGAQAAEKLAQQSMARAVATGAVRGPAAEIPTEVAQQMMERWQAGLPLTTPEALKEYGETMYAAAQVSAPLGGMGRSMERGAAIGQQRAKQDEEERKAFEAQRVAEEAKRQDPAYWQEVEQKYLQAQAQFDQMKKAMPKRDGTAATDALVRQQGEQISLFKRDQLDPLAYEFAKVLPQLRQHRVSEDPLAQVAQQLPQLRQQQEQQEAEAQAAARGQDQDAFLEYQMGADALRQVQRRTPQPQDTSQLDWMNSLNEPQAPPQQPSPFEAIGQAAMQAGEEGARNAMSPEEFSLQGMAPTPGAAIQGRENARVRAAAQGLLQDRNLAYQFVEQKGAVVPGLTARENREVKQWVTQELRQSDQQQFQELPPATTQSGPDAAMLEQQNAANLEQESEERWERVFGPDGQVIENQPIQKTAQALSGQPQQDPLDNAEIRDAQGNVLPTRFIDGDSAAQNPPLQSVEELKEEVRSLMRKREALRATEPNIKGPMGRSQSEESRQINEQIKELLQMIRDAEEWGANVTARPPAPYGRDYEESYGKPPGRIIERVAQAAPQTTPKVQRAPGPPKAEGAPQMDTGISREKFQATVRYARQPQAAPEQPADLRTRYEQALNSPEVDAQTKAALANAKYLLDDPNAQDIVAAYVDRALSGELSTTTRTAQREVETKVAPEGMPATASAKVVEKKRVPVDEGTVRANLEPLKQATEKEEQASREADAKALRKTMAVERDEATKARFLKDLQDANKVLPQLQVRIGALTRRIKELASEKVAPIDNPVAANQRNRGYTEGEAAIKKIMSMIPDRMMLAGAVEDARQKHGAAMKAVRENKEAGDQVGLQKAADEAQRTFEQLFDSENSFNKLEKEVQELDTFIKISRGDAAVRGAGYKKADNTKEIEKTQEEVSKARKEFEPAFEKGQKAAKELRRISREERQAKEAVERLSKEEERSKRLQEAAKRRDEQSAAQKRGEVGVTKVEGISELTREAREKGGFTDPLAAKNPIKQKARLTRERKKLQEKIDAAKGAVTPKYNRESFYEARVERLERMYKNLKSADEREAFMPRIDEAREALRTARQRNKSTPIAYKGMKEDSARLAEIDNQLELLEPEIEAYRRRLEEKGGRESIREAGIAAQARLYAQRRAAEKEAADEAAKRADAPELDTKYPAKKKEKPVTKSAIDAARKAKPTLYQGNLGPSGQAAIQERDESKARAKSESERSAGQQTSEENKDAVARVKRELAEMFPDNKDYPHSKIEVYGDYDSFYEGAKLPEKERDSVKESDGAFTYGGVVYLIGRNLKPGQVASKVLHEVGAHIGFRNMFNESQYKGLSSVVESWMKRNDGSREAEIGKAVKARLKEAGIKKTDSNYIDEVLGYGVEEAVNAGVKGASPQIKGWLERMVRRFEEALAKFFGGKVKLNAQHLVDLAYGAAHRELSTKVGTFEGAVGPSSELLFSRGSPKYASGLDDAKALTDKLVARDSSLWQSAKKNLFGLNFRTQFVDSAAPLEKVAAEFMDPVKGAQMMFYVRMYGQRGNFLSQAATEGAPILKELTRARDGRKEWIIEASGKNSLKDVAETLKGAAKKAGSVDAANELFTAYTVAQRAKRVGLKTLDSSGKLTQADIDKAMSNIESKGLLPDFEMAYERYSQFNKSMMEFAVATGALSRETFNKLTRTGDYVPYYRERGGNYELIIGDETPIKIGNLKDAPHLKELLGGDEKVMDFMTSSVQNASMLLDMSLRNLATKNAVYELRDIGSAKIVARGAKGDNVVHFFDKGEERAAIIDTDRLGVPADLLVKGMAGIPTMLPAMVRALGVPAQFLRKAVTLNPLYAARQLFRDSTASVLVTGADTIPVLSALKQWNGKDSPLAKRGVTGGQIVTGNAPEDIALVMRQIASGKGSVNALLGKAEAMAMNADASSRRAQYESMRRQGLSEMEATLSALESMNFNKRGVSPSVQLASTLIPFFNAQIQGLDVLYKAVAGKMPFNDRLRIREKLYTRGLMLAASTMAYAALMQDDEAYQNATPEEKYNNWFVRIPGVDQPIRVPIPFELGYIFKAIPEAVFNTMFAKDKGRNAEDAGKAAKAIVKGLIPGGTSYGIPQAIKPMLEVVANKSFYTGNPIESGAEQGLLPEFRFRDNTSELSKEIGELTGTSPVMIDHLIRGYGASIGLALAQSLSFGAPAADRATRRLSDTPVIGPIFQPNDAQGIINAVYDKVNHVQQVKKTFDEMVKRGQGAEARAFLQKHMTELVEADATGDFKRDMGELAAFEKAIKADTKLSADKKREVLDQIRKRKIEMAKSARALFEKI